MHVRQRVHLRRLVAAPADVERARGRNTRVRNAFRLAGGGSGGGAMMARLVLPEWFTILSIVMLVLGGVRAMMMLAGFATNCPMNRMLIRKGIKGTM